LFVLRYASASKVQYAHGVNRGVFMTSLQTRVVNILTKPADEWRTIAAEPATIEGLMQSYAAPLAAIPAVAQLLGSTLVGVTVPFLGTVRIGFARAAASAIVSWVLALVGAWIAAVVVEKLAPNFQSKGDTPQALKLVVYAMTPVWVAGILNLVPVLGVLVIVAALYAIYLFYLGLPPVMSTPPDKTIPYMLVSALVIIVVSIVLGAITTALFGIGASRAF
jgi:Yip1 domain